jgi:uncharacterized membrane protein
MINAIDLYTHELLVYTAAITSVSLIVLVVLVIFMYKVSKKLHSIESSWHSFLLGSHRHKERYPVHHHHH